VADTLVDAIAQWRAGALQLADFDADVVAARNAWAQGVERLARLDGCYCLISRLGAIRPRISGGKLATS